MEMWMIWVIAAIIFAIIEIYTPSFFVMWFSVGSIAAAISSIFTDNEIIQLVVFVLVSIVLVLSTKKLTDKFITKKHTFKSNTDKLIGLTGWVSETIEPSKSKGRVKVSGESWKATSTNGSVIEKDAEILVEKLDGVTLVVKLKK